MSFPLQTVLASLTAAALAYAASLHHAATVDDAFYKRDDAQ
jgi:hypothetical protein